MIASLVYLLCAATSIACAWLLFSSYRKTRAPLLFWSYLCFVFLALGNIFLFVDLVLTGADVDLYLLRGGPTLIGALLLIWGLIWEVE